MELYSIYTLHFAYSLYSIYTPPRFFYLTSRAERCRHKFSSELKKAFATLSPDFRGNGERIKIGKAHHCCELLPPLQR